LRANSDLLISIGDSQIFTKISCGTSNLDLGLEELSKVSNDEDFVFNRLCAVDVEIKVNFLDLLCFLSECHFTFKGGILIDKFLILCSSNLISFFLINFASRAVFF